MDKVLDNKWLNIFFGAMIFLSMSLLLNKCDTAPSGGVSVVHMGVTHEK